MDRFDLLVVDDEAVVCAAVVRVLEAAGFRVATASDGAAGLAHPAARTCAAALCDLILPDCSGIDVVRELHSRRPELPIIVITGYASTEALGHANEAGARAFLAKPFDGEELLGTVRAVLGEPESAPPSKEGS